MSDPQRREFLAAAGIASLAALGGAQPAAGGDPSFKNNVPDPMLAGKELPTFKFELEKSEGKVIGDSYGKEATVKQLPISKGIAGVSMRLEPGAMRELHWHATAAEWAFVLEGRVRTTVIDPGGLAETNDFEPGDVWYFPRGHGHMLQCLGDKPCHFILIFDNGYFSEFGTFSITDWIGHTPPALLAKNFGLPESAFATFPKEEVYFARGNRRRPSRRRRCRAGSCRRRRTSTGCWPSRRMRSTGRPRVARRFHELPDLEDDHGRGPRPRSRRAAELHWHPNADEWQYVIEGEVSVTLFGSHGRYRTETLAEGRRRLHPAGLRPLDRERRQRSLPRPDRLQHGRLRGDRPVAMDRGKPDRRAGDQLRQAGGSVREIPGRDVFIAGKEWGQ